MLRYASGAVLYGSNIREALEQLSAILVAEGYPPITIVDGDREYQKQVDIFLARYVLAGDVRGRHVYDVRWWEGRQYFRISSAGTVAPPSRTAPHVARIAADLGSPYNNRNTAAHKRLQQLAPAFGIKWTGVNFGEDWHWETVRGVGIIGAPAGGAGTEFDMPLTQSDLIAILEAKFEVTGPDGKKFTSSVKQALGFAVLTHAATAEVPKQVWEHPLVHTVSQKPVTAGTLLRYEPAEHANTRQAIAALSMDSAPVVEAVRAALKDVPGVDLERVRAAVIDGLDAALPALGAQVTAAARAGIDGATITAS